MLVAFVSLVSYLFAFSNWTKFLFGSIPVSAKWQWPRSEQNYLFLSGLPLLSSILPERSPERHPESTFGARRPELRPESISGARRPELLPESASGARRLRILTGRGPLKKMFKWGGGEYNTECQGGGAGEL